MAEPAEHAHVQLVSSQLVLLKWLICSSFLPVGKGLAPPSSVSYDHVCTPKKQCQIYKNIKVRSDAFPSLTDAYRFPAVSAAGTCCPPASQMAKRRALDPFFFFDFLDLPLHPPPKRGQPSVHFGLLPYLHFLTHFQ